MTMQADLRARLLGETGAGTRVYWVERPQATALPAITLQTITEGRAQLLQGFDSLQESRVQLDVWANSYADAQSISDAALNAVIPSEARGGTQFSRTMVENLRDLLEDTGTTRVFRKSMDLILHHSTA